MEHVSSSQISVLGIMFRATDRAWLGRALYDDACLFVVPKSHREPRTPEQRAQSSTQDAPADPLTMPGAICVKLKGQIRGFCMHIIE